MSQSKIDKYLNFIRHEIEKCQGGKKWGCLKVELHFKNGDIGSIKISLDKFLKLEKEALNGKK